MWLSEGQGWGIWGRAGQGLVGYQPLLGNPDTPPRLARTRISRFPWVLPLFSGLGTCGEFGITQQYLLAQGGEIRVGSSSMWLPLKSRAERLGESGDRWAGSGLMGLFLGGRELLPAPASAPASPLGSWSLWGAGEIWLLG